MYEKWIMFHVTKEMRVKKKEVGINSTIHTKITSETLVCLCATKEKEIFALLSKSL